MTFESIDIQKYIDLMATGALSYLPKVIWALLVMWIGFKIVNILGRLIDKLLTAKHIDPTVEAFLVSLLKNILKALVFVAAIGILWVETSSFVAMFAAVGLAIGMALSGTLWHFASGIMILLFKPYRVGDVVETAGHTGKVKEVQIFNTILETPQGRIIIIPNSEAIGSSIVNMSIVEKKRIDLSVGIAYSDSIDKAREVLHKVADDEDIVLHDEGVSIGVAELWDNAVILTFRTWVKSEDALGAPLVLNEAIKKAFDATKGELNFPFPQRDVHLYQAK